MTHNLLLVNLMPADFENLPNHTLQAEGEDDVRLSHITGMMSSLLTQETQELLEDCEKEGVPPAKVFFSFLIDNPFNEESSLYGEKILPTQHLPLRKLHKVIGEETKILGVYTFIDPSYKTEEVKGLRLATYVPKENLENVLPSLKDISDENEIYTVINTEEDLDNKLGGNKILRLVTQKYDGYILTTQIVSKNDRVKILMEEMGYLQKHNSLPNLVDSREKILKITNQKHILFIYHEKKSKQREVVVEIEDLREQLKKEIIRQSVRIHKFMKERESQDEEVENSFNEDTAKLFQRLVRFGKPGYVSRASFIWKPKLYTLKYEKENIPNKLRMGIEIGGTFPGQKEILYIEVELTEDDYEQLEGDYGRSVFRNFTQGLKAISSE